MIRISAFPHFRFSIFPGFNISGSCVNLHLTLQSRLNRGFIPSCSSEISIFWSKMRPAKLNFWFSSKLSPLNGCFTELISSKRYTVSPVLSFGLLAWDSKMAAYQQFLKHIYWNFMESGISGIGIWLNLWVSANNELGKPFFWQNLLEIETVITFKLLKSYMGFCILLITDGLSLHLFSLELSTMSQTSEISFWNRVIFCFSLQGN